MDSVLRSTPATLAVTFYGDENPIDADGTVTVTITRADGSVLVSGATASHQGAVGSGTYVHNLPGQSALAHLTCVWTGTFSGEQMSITTHVQIVGGVYFTLAEARKIKGLESVTAYPTDLIAEQRTVVETEFEDACGRAFVPRYARDVLSGDGTNTIMLSKPEPYEVLSIKVDGVDVTAEVEPLLAATWMGELRRTDNSAWPIGDANVVIEYEYGAASVPLDIQRVAKIYLKSLLLDTRGGAIPDRATRMVADETTYTLAVPGRAGYITGIPDVDAILTRRTLRSPWGAGAV